MAYIQPLNPFEEKPAGYFPQQKPADYATFGQQAGPWASPSVSSPYANPGYAQNQQAQKALGYMAPVTSGFAAGSQVQPTTNAASAAMQAVGAGVQGAAAGAAIGSIIPGFGTAVGAGVGGLVGLVSGGIQSFNGLKQARAQKRDMDRQYADIMRKEEERLAYEKELNEQARSDNQEGLRYNRRQAALSSQWNAFNSVLTLLNGAQVQDQTMKTNFIQQGR